jgi:putative peptidoglycan lipid II flippase
VAGEGERAGEGPAAAGRRRVGVAAALLAASVLLSRVLGLVRDMVLGRQIGVGPEADAYQAAFQIPDILNYFLAGGALSIALLPLYETTRSRGGPAAAQRLLATVMGTVGGVTVLATVLLVLCADALVALQFPRFDPAQQALVARLTRIVLPGQICFVVGGILRAALMAEGRFVSQALAPLLYNLGIIAGGVFLAPTLGVEGFAWGALAGAVLGALGSAVLEARGCVSLRARFAPFDPDLRRYLVVAAPLMVGVTLVTVDEWYDRWFGQLGGAGAIGVLFYARRVMQLPVAVVGQALATATLPALSRLWSEGRRSELDRMVEGTLRAGLSLGVLAGAASFAFATPAVRLIYQRGAFGADDTAAVAAVLAVFALGVPAWIAQQLAVRPFYARGDTWRPMLLGSAVALAAIPLYHALGARFGARGLAAAGALAISANALATLGMARIVHGAPHLLSLAAGALRAALLAALAGLAAWFAQPGLAGATGALLDLAVGGLAFGAAAGLALALGADPVTRDAALAALRALRRRLPRRASA